MWNVKFFVSSFTKKTLLAASLAWALSSAQADEVSDLLTAMQNSLQSIYKGVHVADKPRVYVLQKSVNTSLELYKKSPIHRTVS